MSAQSRLALRWATEKFQDLNGSARSRVSNSAAERKCRRGRVWMQRGKWRLR